jgi:mRNA-degrading endonuclease toxin of MazEF toxin-antitoxin module
MPEPIGRRPVLLLSRNPAYEYLTRVIAVEITSALAGSTRSSVRSASRSTGRS